MRLFQKVLDLPKVPISLKSKPVSLQEEHIKSPYALQTSSEAWATDGAVKSVSPGPGRGPEPQDLQTLGSVVPFAQKA